MELQGKKAIVTGGAQGIGEAYVRALARGGASVAIVDLNAARAADLARELGDTAHHVIAIPADVSKEIDCNESVARCVSAFGGVDYLVNNAASLRSYLAPPLSVLPYTEFAEIMEVNAHSVFLMTRAAAAEMKPRGGGAIVNTSSVASWLADGAYAVSKALINALTVTFARELGPFGIRVNAVAPGPVMTDGLRQIGSSREKLVDWARQNGKPDTVIAEPEEIADTGLFLLSSKAKHINGQILFADGGTVVRL